MEGLYTGVEWDPEFCVTGALNADSVVTRVAGLPSKLAAARFINGRIAGVPFSNEAEVRDYLVMEGPGALVSMQVIGLSNYEDAVAAARKNRTGNIQTAVTEFRKITGAAPAGAAVGAWLKTPPVQAQLAKVLAAEPRHLSAKLLLEWAKGKPVSQFSLGTSAEEIRKVCANPALGLGYGSSDVDPFAPVPPSLIVELKEVQASLTKLRSRCASQHKDLVGRLMAYGNQRMDFLIKKKPNPQRLHTRDFDKDPSGELMEKGTQLSNEVSRLGLNFAKTGIERQAYAAHAVTSGRKPPQNRTGQ